MGSHAFPLDGIFFFFFSHIPDFGRFFGFFFQFCLKSSLSAGDKNFSLGITFLFSGDFFQCFGKFSTTFSLSC